jgi:16S rRNA (cytidine1402-2'-O)-methyltransferase
MPLTLPTNDPYRKKAKGSLFVVATPIGNKDDITLRALKVLREVDLIAAEDTRITRRFLAQYRIKGNLVSYHEHNEAERTPRLIDKMREGISLALVSNAGTPAVSDPGYRLITAAVANELNVVPVPGVSAAIAALSVAALPTDTFTFIGFLPKKKGKRRKQLDDLANEPRTLIFYESPKRIFTLVEEIRGTLGNRWGILAREITKRHEEFVRGRLSEILGTLKDRTRIKGECTLVVAGYRSNTPPGWEAIEAEIRKQLTATNESASTVARDLAQKYGFAKNKVYAEVLKAKRQINAD